MTMTSQYIMYIYTNCILWTLSDNKVYLILSYLILINIKHKLKLSQAVKPLMFLSGI